MSRRRRQSIAEDVLEQLFDLTGLFWQVGALAGVMLLFFSFSTSGLMNNMLKHCHHLIWGKSLTAMAGYFIYYLY